MHQPPDPRYSSRNPASGNVDNALQELDREMRELQQKMDALRQPPQQAPMPQPPTPQPPAPQPQVQAPLPAPPAPQPPAPPAASSQQADWVDATGADLRRLRDNLNRLTKELASAVDDLLAGIDAMRGRPAAPQPHQAPVAPSAPPVPQPHYEMPVAEMVENVVELDVGPFNDLVAVERFKQALGDLPGVEDVYVKTYGKGRSSIELTVDDRQAVVDEMYVHLPYQLDVVPAPDGKVTVHLQAAPAVEQPEV